MKRRHLMLSTALLAFAGLPARSQAPYPTKPVRLIVPFPPGSGSDLFARLVAQHMSRPLGQPVVVENLPGAGGVIGAAEAARAAPDGYTLLLGGVSINAANESLYKKLPYDMKKSFEPVSKLGGAPLVLVINNSSAMGNVRDVITAARASPGKLTFASGSASSRIGGEMFRSKAGGLDVLHVPYKGSAQAIIDLIAGHVNLMVVDVNTALTHIQGGKLKALAVTSAQRSPFLPDVPTMTEAGVPDFILTGWSALYAPAKTPKDLLAKLSSAVRAAAAEPEYAAALKRNGLGPAEASSPEELGAFTAAEVVKWAAAITAAGIVPD